MKRASLIWAIVTALVWTGTAIAQNLKFNTYLVEDGLSNNSVNHIANDPDGGLWIATWDGLNYFDGRKFTVYRNIPGDSTSLAGNFVTEVYVDSNKRLWIRATPSSISLRKEDFFENYDFGQQIERIGMTIQGDCIVRVDGQNHIFKKGKWVPCKSCQIHRSNLARLNVLLERRHPDLEITESYLDSQGRVWFATVRDGLYMLPTEQPHVGLDADFQHYTVDAANPCSIKSNEVHVIHEDVFGNIWIGLKDGGISMVYRNSNEVYTVYPHPVSQPFLPNETVRAITQDQKGRLWVGYYNSGLYVNDSEKGIFRKFRLTRGDNERDWSRIRSLFTDSSGRIWVGTYAGLARISPSGEVKYFQKEDVPYFPNVRNYDVFEDTEENSLWVACWGGVAKFSLGEDRFVPFEGQELLDSLHVRQVAKIGGKLYIATEINGVAMLDEGKVSFLNNANGLLNNSVFALAEDPGTGNIWIATLGGVSVYHPGQGMLASITQQSGLKSQLVYGLLPSDGHMWISTTNGIGRIDKADYSVRILSPEEGWQGAEFSEGAFYKSERGMMFFGGVNGLNYFYPQNIDLKDELPILKLDLPEEKAFAEMLSNGQLNVSVIPVSFTHNSQNTIQYRLLPTQEEWEHLPSDYQIQMKKLSPGTYILQVRNSLETNSEKYLDLSVNVPRPIWKSPYLWVLSILGASALVLLWRHRSSRAQQARLQKKIDERTTLIRKQKAELEEINQALDAKNKEILAQQSTLLALHQRYKDSDFEMEKFKNYMIGQFRLPLVELKENLVRSRAYSSPFKDEIVVLVNQMNEMLMDWDRVQKIDQIDGEQKSLTIISDLLRDIFGDIKSRLERYQVSYQEDFRLSSEWVELDVLRFKLFWQYLMREIMKYLEEGSEVRASAVTGQHTVEVGLVIRSQLLVRNFEEILAYSPYLKSAFSILGILDGEVDHSCQSDMLRTSVSIPFHTVEKKAEGFHINHWKHLNLVEELDPHKYHVVVLGKRHETDSLMKIICHNQFEMILEEEPKMVVSAIRNLAIDALLIYNEKITQDILDLINAVRQRAREKVEIPMFYISDRLDVGFQDKLMDFGVENFIQLPVSGKFIIKKIEAQLKKIRRMHSERSILDILPEEQVYVSPHERLVKEGLKIIREQLPNGEFKIEELSGMLGVSKIKCYRAFKEVLGTSPLDLVTTLRLEKAQKLLSQSKMNISEVSFACGFNDPKYFSKLFKKNLGKSPRQFQHSRETPGI